MDEILLLREVLFLAIAAAQKCTDRPDFSQHAGAIRLLDEALSQAHMASTNEELGWVAVCADAIAGRWLPLYTASTVCHNVLHAIAAHYINNHTPTSAAELQQFLELLS
jgi:hypothetical protein